MKKFAIIAPAVTAALTGLVLAAAPSHAAPTPPPQDTVQNQSFGCTTSLPMHMTATRINNNNGTSSIYASATSSYKESIVGPDRYWKFYRFTSSTGLQSRYSQPTQWGPMDFSTEAVTVTFVGTVAGSVRPWYKSCTTWVRAGS